jgi:hypothetical protein
MTINHQALSSPTTSFIPSQSTHSCVAWRSSIPTWVLALVLKQPLGRQSHTRLIGNQVGPINEPISHHGSHPKWSTITSINMDCKGCHFACVGLFVVTLDTNNQQLHHGAVSPTLQAGISRVRPCSSPLCMCHGRP